MAPTSDSLSAKPTRRSRCSCASSQRRGSRAWGRRWTAGRARRAVHPPMPPSIAQFLAHAPRYIATVEPAIRFLQGRDPSFALRIVGRELLPEGPRFAQLAAAAPGDDPLAGAFGSLGTTDQARYLASLYVDDLADTWRDGIDPRFELARYGERLAASAPTFDPLEAALDGEPTLVDEALDELTRELVALHRPDVVGMSAPFPGNVYGAFRMARIVRAESPDSEARARRRLGQHRAARAARAARLRLLRLRDARRRRAAAAGSARAAPRAPRAARPHLRAQGRRRRARDRCRRSTTSRRRDTACRPTTACRSQTTCPCSRC